MAEVVLTAPASASEALERATAVISALRSTPPTAPAFAHILSQVPTFFAPCVRLLANSLANHTSVADLVDAVCAACTAALSTPARGAACEAIFAMIHSDPVRYVACPGSASIMLTFSSDNVIVSQAATDHARWVAAAFPSLLVLHSLAAHGGLDALMAALAAAGPSADLGMARAAMHVAMPMEAIMTNWQYTPHRTLSLAVAGAARLPLPSPVICALVGAAAVAVSYALGSPSAGASLSGDPAARRRAPADMLRYLYWLSVVAAVQTRRDDPAGARLRATEAVTAAVLAGAVAAVTAAGGAAGLEQRVRGVNALTAAISAVRPLSANAGSGGRTIASAIPLPFTPVPAGGAAGLAKLLGGGGTPRRARWWRRCARWARRTGRC